MADKKITFTIDLEDWNDALHIPKNGHTSYPYVWWLLDRLEHYGVRAVFYVLGKFEEEYPKLVENIKQDGHIIKTHGYDHYHHEEADRKPYAWLGFTGGFYFRFFPYWFVKWNVRRKGMFYIHPHDLDKEHPVLPNPLLNFKRHVGLKKVASRLERLLADLSWAN